MTAYLLVGLLFITLTSNQTRIDSLKTAIETADEDTTRIKALLKLGDQFEFSEPDKALKHYERALLISKGGKHLELQARCENYIGIIYWRKSDYPNALEYYFQNGDF